MMPIVTLADGLDLYVETAGTVGAPAVVLIRGTGADSSRWAPQIEAYRDDFRVVAFDNRGVGRSSTPPGPYSVAAMAADTVALLDALELDAAHLSGSSLGGAIALAVAIEHPDRVLSLQLHSSWLATDGYTRYSLGLLKQLLERGGTEFYYEATLPLLFSPAFLTADHARLLGILANMRANTASYEGLHGQIEANLGHDLRAGAGGVTCPTLVTVGELDLLVPVPASEELAAAIPGAELVVFAGAGHLVTMEAAERFNDTTLAWLRRVSSEVTDPAT
jgi:aminoacrylate hydrolase